MVQAKLEGFVQAVAHYRDDLRNLDFSDRRYQQFHKERKEKIVHLVRILQGRCFVRDLFGAFVQRSAERGWPIITWRRFSQILMELEREDRIRREIRSFGRFGRRTVVQIRTSEVRTE